MVCLQRLFFSETGEDCFPTNCFDQAVSFLGKFSGRCWQVDFALFSFSDNDLLKGGIFMVIVWALWFRSDSARARSLVLCTLFGALAAVVAGKIIEHFLPLRLRPYQLHVAGTHFPYDMGMEDHTSFPSDHAILFSALSMGLYFSSRRIGSAAFFYSILVITFPRIYLGLHHPTDMVGGAVIGILAAILLHREPARALCERTAVAFSREYPGIFYPCFFLITFETGTLFDGIRDFVRMVGIVFGL